MFTVALTAYNHIEYTKMCLSSILENTPSPYKLVLIDNGSSDGTLKYFNEVSEKHGNTKIIRYENNEIVEKCANSFFTEEDNEFIIGVTNDTIVHKGWAENLIACLTSADDIGMVGPLSNCISGTQQVYPGAYFDLAGYKKVAYQWSEDHKGEYHSVDRVVGMLVALRRSAFIKAGGYNVDLSTNGDGYGFSDDDLSRKMILAGYRLLITNDVFIHHFGGVTVGRDLSEKIKANATKYERILHERY